MAAPAEDRLSDLPDDLLHQILSFLPSTNLVVQTSVLAKRWRHLWACQPNIRFSMAFTSKTAAGDVESIAKSYVLGHRCFRSVDPPLLDSFEIDLRLPTFHSWADSTFPTPRAFADSKVNSLVADRWLRFARLRPARELSIQLVSEDDYRMPQIPYSIFLCRSLTSLTVRSGTFNVPPRFLGFQNLTKLVISGAFISDPAVSRLLDGCPLLEELKLIKCRMLRYVEISARTVPRLKHVLLRSYGVDLRIEAPNLRSLVFSGVNLSIEAPNLRLLEFSGSVSRLQWDGSLLLLDEAEVYCSFKEDFMSFDNWTMTLRVVSNVCLLKVDYWFYQFAIEKDWFAQPLFKNLKELQCCVKWITGSALRSLTCCLRECPLLETFMIGMNSVERSAVCNSVQEAIDPKGTQNTRGKPFLHKDALLKHVEDEYEQDEWNPFEHADELDYYLHHLKFIAVNGFIGSKNEMQLLGFLFAKAVALEQFIVIDLLWREEWDLNEIFASVLRASQQLRMRFPLQDKADNKLLWTIFS